MVPKAKKSTTFSTSKRNLVAAESDVHQRLSAVEQTGTGGAVVVQCEYLDLVSRVSALSRAGRPDRCTPHTVSLLQTGHS